MAPMAYHRRAVGECHITVMFMWRSISVLDMTDEVGSFCTSAKRDRPGRYFYEFKMRGLLC